MRGNQSKDVKLIPVALHFATGGKQKDNCGCLARHCRRKIEEKKRKDFLQNQIEKEKRDLKLHRILSCQKRKEKN